MNLSLVKKADFNGVECNFYEVEGDDNNLYMRGVQIVDAIGYKMPEKVIAEIHGLMQGISCFKEKLAKCSMIANLPVIEAGRLTQRESIVYSVFEGVYLLSRFGAQPEADAFMSWVRYTKDQLQKGRASGDMTDLVSKAVKATFKEFTKQLAPLLKEALTSADTVEALRKQGIKITIKATRRH